MSHDDRVRAFDAYARAAVSFASMVRRLKNGEDALEDRADAEDAVLDLVEVGLSQPSALIETIAAVRDNVDSIALDYHARHAANTCVYAILIGLVLGMDRVQLVELGDAALFADLGLALLPSSRTQSARPFSNKDRRGVRAMMMQGAQVMLGSDEPSAADARLVVAAYEHHAPYRSRTHRTVTRRHPYSRIVAVADVYDAYRSPRPWRNPYSPIDAIRAVRDERDEKFDPLVVDALEKLHEIESRDDSAIAYAEVRDFVRLDASGGAIELDL